MSKKLFSLIIVFALVIGCLPASAFGQDQNGGLSEDTLAATTVDFDDGKTSPYGPKSIDFYEGKAHAYDPFLEEESMDFSLDGTDEGGDGLGVQTVDGVVVFKIKNLYGNSAPYVSRSKLDNKWIKSLKKINQQSNSRNESVYIAKVEKGKEKDVIKSLKSRKDIVYAEPQYVFNTTALGEPQNITTEMPASLQSLPNSNSDPNFAQQWYLQPAGISDAWNWLNQNGYAWDGAGTIVAVIDTGVDYTHEDLSASMWTNGVEANGIPGVDDDQNGYVDDIHGASTVFATSEHSGNPMDNNGHGTHVAGIIAATANNGLGGTGVAPGTKIMAVKAGQYNGVFYSTDIAEAVDYAVMMGADVINMSFGGYGESLVVKDALENAYSTCVLVAAAGNDDIPTTEAPDWMKQGDMYPASFPWVIGVMASDQTNNKAGFSNWDYNINGSPKYEMIAPGTDVFSTLPGNKYASWSGTSMATPVVSATAALIRGRFTNKMEYPSRFIMGQVVGATNSVLGYEDLLHRDHSYTLLNVLDSASLFPAPAIDLSAFYIFDTSEISAFNNSDAIVDAGETINLALTLRNQWGLGTNVEVTVDAGGSPYVNLINSTVNYGNVGSFGEKDNGLIIDAEGNYTGVEAPFTLSVSDTIPNDYQIRISYTITADNGYNASSVPVVTQGYFDVLVRNGEVLSGTISQDKVLTKEKYWIISDTVYIPKGVQVRVEPGTQIQFYSGDPQTPYAFPPIPRILVDGAFIAQGTLEEPISIFPSDAFSRYAVEIVDGIGASNIQYAMITNPTIAISTGDHLLFKQEEWQLFRRELIGSNISLRWTGARIAVTHLSNSRLYQIGWSLPTEYQYFTVVSSIDMNTCLFDNIRTILYSQQVGNSTVVNSPTMVLQPTVFSKKTTKDSIAFDPVVEYNGHYYTRVTNYADSIIGTDYNISDLERLAKALGGYLVTISSEDENNFINSLGWSGYIGLNIRDKSRLFWDNGEDFNYSKASLTETHYENFIFNNGVWPSVYFLNYQGAGILEFDRPITIEELQSFDESSILQESFTNNAILNRMFPGDDFLLISADGTDRIIDRNWWGTTQAVMIENQIVDSNDIFGLYDIDPNPFLTTPPEDCFPFVTDCWVTDANGDRQTRIGAGTNTFHVTFNRDMNQIIEPRLTFGPDEPYTDFIVNGAWIDSRTYVGTFEISSNTGDGYQYLRISGARAADDSWLVTGEDLGRYRFEIVTTGTESLNLQASGGENRIDLSWMQDDFETLAGYNLYRSETEGGTYQKINDTIIPAGIKQWQDTDVEPGQTYYYKFTVVQTDMSESGYSNIASASALDNIKPVIDHTPQAVAASDLPLQVTATMTDNIGIQLATIFYRTQGTTTWQQKTMQQVSGTNNYTASIESQYVKAPGVEYYLEAWDGTSATRKGAPTLPLQVPVSSNPVLTSVSPGTGTNSGGYDVTLSGVNFASGCKVYFGTNESSMVSFVSASQLKATVPAGGVGYVDVKVINPDTKASTLGNGFLYYDDTLRIQAGDCSGMIGDVVSVPVMIENAANLGSAELELHYNPDVLSYQSLIKGLTLGSGWISEVNATSPGTLRIALAGLNEISGDITLCSVNFVVSGVGASTLALSGVKANGVAVTGTIDGTFTYVPRYSISGTVSYYSGGAPVSGVALSTTGASATTSGDGHYSLNNLVPGNYSISIGKSDSRNGISAYDAALVLQKSVGKLTLSSNQAIAGDVNGDGTVSAQDATNILKASVGAITGPFPGSLKVWDFVPSSMSISNLASNETRNLTAILLGDVSGNWNGSGAQTLTENSIPAKISVPVGIDFVDIPLDISAVSALGIDLSITYNPADVTSISFIKNDAFADWVEISNSEAGTLRIGLAGSNPVSAENIGWIRVGIASNETGPVEISVGNISLNEATVVSNRGVTILREYTVGFSSMGGNAVASIKADYNSSIQAPVVPTRTGYTFGGWYKESSYGHVWNFSTDKVAGDTTLYAKWIPNSYSIKFSGNGSSSGTTSTMPMTYDVSKTLATNGFIKSGYSFLGWATTPTGSVLYADKASVKNLTATNGATVTLYAKWGAPIASAASYNYNSVKVSWAAAGGATSYKIYRATSATGTYSLVYTAASTTRSWVNTGLVTGKYYYYKVYPVAGGKTYAHSTYKYAKPYPAAPSVSVVKASTTSIKVTWTGVSGATKYQIFRATSASGTYSLVYTATSTLRSWTNTGLKAGTTYYYKVRAYHLEGTTNVFGAYSAVKYLKL